MNFGVLLENIRLSFGSLRSQPLRTSLTMLIIAFGITALVGILTATSAIEETIAGNFTQLGATTYTIQNRSGEVRIGRGGRNITRFSPIDYLQASSFKSKMEELGLGVVSMSFIASSVAEVGYRERKTNPNVTVMAVDLNYLFTNGFELAVGRNFTESEFNASANVCIIGSEVAEKLFAFEQPVGQMLRLRNNTFTVVGVLEAKGSSFGFSGDRSIMIPLRAATALFPLSSKRTHALNIRTSSTEQMEESIMEATGVMRVVRRLRPGDANDFSITRSDNLSAALIDQLSYVTIAATGIGLITLLGAAVALMNIMLVSVTERTREIGTRKALGASPSVIRMQFLTEAISLGLTGGLVGVVMGVAIGNVVSFQIGNAFIMPWPWVGLGLFLCFITAVISGYYPAARAARLDPVEALRYE
jgi:putative ABC transport system permease protein